MHSRSCYESQHSRGHLRVPRVLAAEHELELLVAEVLVREPDALREAPAHVRLDLEAVHARVLALQRRHEVVDEPRPRELRQRLQSKSSATANQNAMGGMQNTSERTQTIF